MDPLERIPTQHPPRGETTTPLVYRYRPHRIYNNIYIAFLGGKEK
nr:MAG TPA: hypothetical protein [Caudoviricetes sp.]